MQMSFDLREFYGSRLLRSQGFSASVSSEGSNFSDSVDDVADGNKADALFALEIRQISEQKGKGVFARQDFRSKEVVFVEEKYVGLQHKESQATARCCMQCMRYVGTTEEHLQRCVDAEQERALKKARKLQRKGQAVDEKEAKLEERIVIPALPFKVSTLKDLECSPVPCIDGTPLLTV